MKAHRLTPNGKQLLTDVVRGTTELVDWWLEEGQNYTPILPTGHTVGARLARFAVVCLLILPKLITATQQRTAFSFPHLALQLPCHPVVRLCLDAEAPCVAV